MQYAIVLVSLLVAGLDISVQAPQHPFHMSILSRQGRVTELLLGHDDRIHTCLGVCKEEFCELISVMLELEFTDSHHLLLEEQPAIFLYGSITGLTMLHLAEQFQ